MVVEKQIYECATCGGELNVPADAMIGELLACPDCGVEYEVISLDNGEVKLAAAENIKEDWGE